LCRRLKPAPEENKRLFGTTEVVPCYKAFKAEFLSSHVKPAQDEKGGAWTLA
jgi:hypothetical protein